MGTILSPARNDVPIIQGLELLNRGKVRDTYKIDDKRLLVVATDAVSIFDHVLNALIPEKGIVLNLLSHFWFTMLADYGIKTHMMHTGVEMADFLPDRYRNDSELLSRSMIVHKLNMKQYEFIARGFITGSGLKAYQQNGSICGHRLPTGLLDGDKLPFNLDTPTTKADVGHDEHVEAEKIRKQFPGETYLLLQLFQIVSSYLSQRGIIIADTKLEFGSFRGSLQPILADEVFTPDSSRFWEKSVWESLNALRKGKIPPPIDKQVVRKFGLSLGINKRKPELAEDVAWVHAQTIPNDLIAITAQTYRYIFWRITGLTIENYAKNLGIDCKPKKKKVAIILGSVNDVHYINNVMQIREAEDYNLDSVEIHVISCHRNPNELRSYVENGCNGADVIVAAGGKAFALPGVLDALIAASGRHIPVIGVALGEPNSKALQAAVLSIDELPGQPVVMDEISKKVYQGPQGLSDALVRIALGELPPQIVRERKPAEFDISLSPLT